MADYFPFILTLDLFIFSIIFIVGAYTLQISQKINNWKSKYIVSIKNIMAILSLISMLISLFVYIILKPF